MITEALLIGLIAGIIFYELFDISPGGVISPGYFALFINQPLRLFSTLLVALVVWGIIELLSKHLILYGKRKFVLALLIGFCLKIFLDQFLLSLIPVNIDILTIGYIIPGLIANEMSRQSPLKTVYALTTVSTFVYLILLLIH